MSLSEYVHYVFAQVVEGSTEHIYVLKVLRSITSIVNVRTQSETTRVYFDSQLHTYVRIVEMYNKDPNIQ